VGTPGCTTGANLLECRVRVERTSTGLQPAVSPIHLRHWREHEESNPGLLVWRQPRYHYAILPCFWSFNCQRAKKRPAFSGGPFRILIVPGLYPPPFRPGLVAMMALPICQWAHTNMLHGLSDRPHRVSALGNLNTLNLLSTEAGNLTWRRSGSN
jgi:hypothetical protein